MNKQYEVIFVGAPKDGEVLATFNDEMDAIKFARQYWDDHKDEFDQVCGGVAIMDPDGHTVENW